MRLRIGVSSCLLGFKVRYDGGHKKDDLLADLWARHLEFVPVCPEMEAGLGVPRPPIHLELRGKDVLLTDVKSGLDVTDQMTSFAEARCSALAAQDLSGFIFKKDSPSCGVWRVKVHRKGNVPLKDGRGLFARAFMEACPLVPVEEEGRLNDVSLRENFLVRVFAYRRLRDFFSGRWTLGLLSAFHAREKLLLMAHAPAGYAALGRRVAQAKGQGRAAFAADYQADFMRALENPAPVSRHVNALQHMAGYFKNLLPPGEKAELHAAVGDYGRGLAPWLVPATLLRHHVRRHGVSYLQGQTYLDPHPKELMLRSHA